MFESRSGQAVSELGMTLVSAAVENIPAQFRILKLPKRSVDIKKFLFFNDKTVICLDDLERAKIDLEELFGFVNGMVERDGIKIVFIANEHEIELYKTNKEQYKKVKEKLIRITMNFEPKIVEAIPTVIEESTTGLSSSRVFFLSHIREITDYCHSAKIYNIRIIKHALALFAYAWEELSDIEWITNAVRLNALRFTLAITNEHMVGSLDIRSLLEYENDKNFRMLNYIRQNRDSNTEQQPVSEFVDRYFSSANDYLYSRAMIEFVSTGFMDREQHLGDLSAEVGPHPSKDAVDVLLNGFWELSDDEFETAIVEVLNRIDNGVHYSIYSYPHVFATLSYFTRLNLTGISLDELVGRFIAGMSKAADHSKYHDNPIGDIRDRMNNEGLKEDEKLAHERVRQALNDHVTSLRTKYIQGIAHEASTLMNSDFKAFSLQICQLDSEMGQGCVLESLGSSVLYERLIRCENPELALFQSCLKERYKYKHMRDRLEPERPVLTELVSRLSTLIQEQPHRLSRALIQEIITVWESIDHNWDGT